MLLCTPDRCSRKHRFSTVHGDVNIKRGVRAAPLADVGLETPPRGCSAGMLEFVGYEVLPPVVTYAPARLDAAERTEALRSARARIADRAALPATLTE